MESGLSDSFSRVNLPVTSQIKDDSQLEQLGKYYVHGLLFGIGLMLLGLTALSLSLIPLVFGIVGAIILGIFSAILIAWGNADLCSWLWDIEVRRYWMYLLGQGILLLVALNLALAVSYPISEFLFQNVAYEIYLAIIALILVITLPITGYLCKRIGEVFAENI